MPFINGRYYMNPAYGQFAKRARAGQSAQTIQKGQNDPRGNHGTRDEKHLSSHRLNSPQDTSQQAETAKTNKTYNEFSGLRPKKGVTTSADLDQARINAAHVYYNVRGKGFQGSSNLGRNDARDIKIPGTLAAQGYQATKVAVADAAKKPDVTQNANHVYIYDREGIRSGRVHPPDWVIHGQTTTVAGPFINESGGDDIKRGDEIYIITVNDRNIRHRD